MRIAILPALLPAVLFPAFAQVAKPAPAPDPQVRQLLDELGYEYEVDEDGDYRLVFEVANRLLEHSGEVIMGGWVRHKTMAMFVVKVAEDATPQQLRDAIEAAAACADTIEKELTPGKDEL